LGVDLPRIAKISSFLAEFVGVLEKLGLASLGLAVFLSDKPLFNPSIF